MKPGRNDPCSCGSGLKYKKCCGAAQKGASGGRAQAPSMVSVRPIVAKGEPRPCGDCSLCCDGWLKTHVLGHDIALGHPCPFSDGHHCTIHEKRPHDPCRVFFCGWAEAGSHLPEWMWPKQSGVIVLTGRSQWRGRPVDVLVSAGRDPDEKVLGWYQDYSIKSLRPFLYQRNEQWFGFGPEEFQRDIAAKAARGEALWT
ncbi:MAG: SEC-C metal-binding domain-containing protein [Pseudomonadota bacterium]